MKKVLVFALIAVFALSLSSCGKKKEKTNTEKLCIEKGWVLSSATAAPYYVNSDGDQIHDIYNDYLEDFEKDDIIVFNTNYSQIIKPGSKLPTEEDSFGYTAEVAATWEFASDETELKFQIPFFYDESGRKYDADIETAKITLSETALTIIYTYNVVDTKEACTFTLNYVPAK